MLLTEKNSDMKNLLCDGEWLSKLAYLTDIFDRLNTLNMSLQGANTTPFTANDKINSKKLVLLCSQIQEKNVSAFPTLSSFLEENDISPKPDVFVDILLHLEPLQGSFNKYFFKHYSKLDWIRNPFAGRSPNELELQEKFIDYTEDSSMIDVLKEKSLIHFWMGCKSEYPVLS